MISDDLMPRGGGLMVFGLSWLVKRTEKFGKFKSGLYLEKISVVVLGSKLGDKKWHPFTGWNREGGDLKKLERIPTCFQR